jgi:hypothetical protein
MARMQTISFCLDAIVCEREEMCQSIRTSRFVPPLMHKKTTNREQFPLLLDLRVIRQAYRIRGTQTFAISYCRLARTVVQEKIPPWNMSKN